MIRMISVLLLFQLAGETLSRGLGLSLPGPVLGLAGLFVALLASPKLAEAMRPVATGLLSHLSLLFVPAGVGVVAHLGTFATHGAGLAIALVGSTVLAILAGLGAFLLVARLTGQAGQGDD